MCRPGNVIEKANPREMNVMTDFVVADAAIRQLHARYTDAVWRKDYPSFGDCFAEDCEWRIGGLALEGRKEIVDTFSTLMVKFKRVLITIRSPILEVGNGTASGRTYFTEQSMYTDGKPLAAIGTYYEHFVDQGDRWRFKWRLFQTQYAGSPDISGPFFDNPEFGPPPNMPPLDAIPTNHSGNFPKKGAA
jgi:ketosteroid isomerase-like protein